MEKKYSLLEEARLNNNEIDINKIVKLELDERQYEEAINFLIENNIKITDAYENNEEPIDQEDIFVNDVVISYLKQISAYPVLTKEEEINLFKEYQKEHSKSIREKLVKCNLRLVVFIVKKYRNKTIDFIDQIQEGNVGLIRAIDKFNPELGYKFSTYASWWIKQAVRSKPGDIVKIPAWRRERIQKVLRFRSGYYKAHGVLPTYKEISESLGYSIQEIGEDLIYSQDTLSFDAPVVEDGSVSFGEVAYHYENRESELVEEIYFSELLDLIKKVISPKEYEVLSLRYGLYNTDPLTLEEIGKKYGITRERVRQIEARALRKIKQKLIFQEKIQKSMGRGSL